MPRIITFGEIMLRLSTPGYLRFSQAKQFDATCGGGEANVAVSLANYGMDVQFVTRFPATSASSVENVSEYIFLRPEPSPARARWFMTGHIPPSLP